MPRNNGASSAKSEVSINTGTFKGRFYLDRKLARKLTAEIVALLETYGDAIVYVTEPPRVRNRAPGPYVRARRQLIDLRKRRAIPPRIDEMIKWRTGAQDEKSLPTRGPMDDNTLRAYWQLVDQGLIDDPIPENYRPSG